MKEKPLILFDGVCNLCNRSVQYVIQHDPEGIFNFASLQGETGQQLLKKYNLPVNDFNSFVLVENEKVFINSTGALKVAKRLNGMVRLLYGFIIIPPFIRNAVYNLIARNRYKWFGKKDSCMVPSPALKTRFLN